MRENLFNGTSVNRQTLRIEVENVLHLLLYIPVGGIKKPPEN